MDPLFRGGEKVDPLFGVVKNGSTFGGRRHGASTFSGGEKVDPLWGEVDAHVSIVLFPNEPDILLISFLYGGSRQMTSICPMTTI